MKVVLKNEVINYHKLNSGDKFIYIDNDLDFEYVGFKFNGEFAIFLYGNNKFLVGKVCENHFSIGESVYYETYQKAEHAIITFYIISSI